MNALIFGGQGTQYLHMGCDLVEHFPKAKKVFTDASEIVNFDILKKSKSITFSELYNLYYSQIFIIAFEVAVFEALIKERYNFSVVAGFSLGEYAALYAAGVLDFTRLFELINHRARLTDEATSIKGNMVAVINITGERVKKICLDYGLQNCDIANYNSKLQHVVSLRREILEDFIVRIKSEGGIAIKLNINRPFHHILMKEIATEYQRFIVLHSIKKPTYEYFSSVTAHTVEKTDEIYKLLIRHMFSPVYWYDTVKNMVDFGIDSFVEISPKPILSHLNNDIVGFNSKFVDIKEYF